MPIDITTTRGIAAWREQLQGERALAADDAQVVEGVHDGGAAEQLRLGRGGGRARRGRRLALDELRVVAVSCVCVCCFVCVVC